MIRKKLNGYEFLSKREIDNQFLNLLIKDFEILLLPQPIKKLDIHEGFTGRGSVIKLNYQNCSYIIRLFRRGGLISKLNSNIFFQSFLGSKSFRPFWEFEIITRLVNHGIKVPTPLAAIVKSSIGNFYRGALVTKELLGSKNFLDLIIANDRDFNVLIEISYRAGIETAKCIRAGVHHTDLHPGNVLCLQSTAYLIDFDKAKLIQGTIVFDDIAKDIISRWDRSLTKRLKKTDGIREEISRSFMAGIYYER